MEEELGLFDLLYIMGDTLQFNVIFMLKKINVPD